MDESSVREMRTLLDANACLRYLLDDIEEQAQAATECIERGCEVDIEVLAECVYVLMGTYQVDRSLVSDTLTGLLDEVACARMRVAKAALGFFAQTKLDFVDCVLLAEKRVNGREVFTFDKKLARELDKQVL